MDLTKLTTHLVVSLVGFIYCCTFQTSDANKEKWETEQKSVEQLQALFEGLKFFINREVDRESMVFHIRSESSIISFWIDGLMNQCIFRGIW